MDIEGLRHRVGNFLNDPDVSRREKLSVIQHLRTRLNNLNQDDERHHPRARPLNREVLTEVVDGEVRGRRRVEIEEDTRDRKPVRNELEPTPVGPADIRPEPGEAPDGRRLLALA